MAAAGQRLLSMGREIFDDILSPHHMVERYLHYPEGDVLSSDGRSQYYFHVHDLGPYQDRTHFGHFHLFCRHDPWPREAGDGLGGATQPWSSSPQGCEVTHLCAIGLNRQGRPLRLFTTNRWVTDEAYYPAAQVLAGLDRFHPDGSRPSDDFLRDMVLLFRPRIAALLAERDRQLLRACAEESPEMVFEDQSRAILSHCEINLEGWVAEVEAALGSP